MVRELAEIHGTIGQRRMGGGAHPFLWAVLRHSAKVPSHSRAGRPPWGIPMAPVQACPARKLGRPVETSPAEIFFVLRFGRVEIRGSARKHGITDEDIRHAIEHALVETRIGRRTCSRWWRSRGSAGCPW